MFGSIGFPEILLILVLALLIFGPKRLPEVGRTIGKGLAEFRRASSDLKRTVNAELALRWGNTGSPWWESSTESGDYAGQLVVTGPRPRTDRMTFQVYAGVKARARLYNSFLQGQFRDSDLAYSSSQVGHVLFEAWLGVDFVLKNNFSISYFLRRQTRELEDGRGAHAFTWAGLSLAHRY